MRQRNEKGLQSTTRKDLRRAKTKRHNVPDSRRALHMHVLERDFGIRAACMQHDCATCASMLRDAVTAAQSRFLATFWCLDRMRYWFVDGKRSLPFPFRFCRSSSIAHVRAKRRSNELDSHAFQMGAWVERFKRSETLRLLSSPFLSKSLKKALLYRCEMVKVHTCMATESKQIPVLVMAKLRLPASCCELLLPSFVWRPSMHMAGRKQRSLFL